MEQFRKYYNENQLLALSEGQPDWGVTVHTVGHNVHEPKVDYPDHRHPNPYFFDWKNGRILNEFQLVYIAGGSGTFEADGVAETVVEAGTAFLLFPGVWHRYKPCENTGWEEFWVGYGGHYADYLMNQNCFQSKTPFVHIGFNAELLNVFIRLIETVKYEGIAYHQLSSCLITQLLALVYSSAIMTDKRHQNTSKLIKMARFKMHNNLYKNMDVKLLAAELNVSYPWLRRAFKDIVGVAPGQYHLNIRIEKACKILKETDLMVNEVSYYLGFESEFHFSRLFKKKTGISPGKYRLKS